MGIRVTTSDGTTTSFPDISSPTFREGGVLRVDEADGTTTFYSPSFWITVEQEPHASAVYVH